jgi:predicted amidohydrolase
VKQPLTLAVAQPRTVDGDVVANAIAHAAVVSAAGCRVVVLPELSLTGYVLDSPAVDCDEPALAPLVRACTRHGTVALAGAPVIDAAGARSIAILAVSDRVRVVYRKMHLGEAEAATFVPGPSPAVIEVDGWRIGLGICKDTGVAQHVDATARLGVDVYAAGLVDRPDDRPVQEARARSIAAACGASVAFASFAGPTGGGYRETAGRSGIWAADGRVLATTDEGVGAICRATLS